MDNPTPSTADVIAAAMAVFDVFMPVLVLAVGITLGARLLSMVMQLFGPVSVTCAVDDHRWEYYAGGYQKCRRCGSLRRDPALAVVSQSSIDAVNSRRSLPAQTGVTIVLRPHCDVCGEVVEPGAEFCVFCGARLHH